MVRGSQVRFQSTENTPSIRVYPPTESLKPLYRFVYFLSPIRTSGIAPPTSGRYHVDLRTLATSTSSGQWNGITVDRNLPAPMFQVVHHPPMADGSTLSPRVGLPA
jgi:hypothetical protein